MAHEEKKGGFFAKFRKSTVSGNENIRSESPTPSVAQVQNRPAAPESRNSLLSAEPPKPVVVQKSSPVPVDAEPVIDTVANFNFLCKSLADIGVSQLKVVDMTLTMLSNSLNKIVDGLKKKG
ncbi:MAG: hypothetical protein WCI23_02800 [Chlorobiaceae bacterium]|jgi:hypothetical protein